MTTDLRYGVRTRLEYDCEDSEDSEKSKPETVALWSYSPGRGEIGLNFPIGISLLPTELGTLRVETSSFVDTVDEKGKESGTEVKPTRDSWASESRI
jgi:hypothetical protein